MSTNKPTKPNEELSDPWALPPVESTTVASAVPTGAAAAAKAKRSLSSLPPVVDDGRIDYSCLYPAAAGAIFGSVGGAILNVFGKQLALTGAFQGALTMTVVSVTSCALIKGRNGSIYDHAYDRTVAYAAGGATWPMSGELYRVVRRQPVLSPTIALRRTVTGAVAGAIFGGVMDYFDLARPTPPRPTEPPQ